MLFLAISTPRPERPSTQLAARKTFWPWMAALEASGRARWCYARPGRGAAALFDVPDIEALHALLNQWAEMIPATFELFPLIDGTHAKAFLASGGAGAKPARRAAKKSTHPQGASKPRKALKPARARSATRR